MSQDTSVKSANDYSVTPITSTASCDAKKEGAKHKTNKTKPWPTLGVKNASDPYLSIQQSSGNRRSWHGHKHYIVAQIFPIFVMEGHKSENMEGHKSQNVKGHKSQKISQSV